MWLRQRPPNMFIYSFMHSCVYSHLLLKFCYVSGTKTKAKREQNAVSTFKRIIVCWNNEWKTIDLMKCCRCHYTSLYKVYGIRQFNLKICQGCHRFLRWLQVVFPIKITEFIKIGSHCEEHIPTLTCSYNKI